MLLVLAAALVLAGCKTEIYSSLPERDANEMVSLLATAGIQAIRERNKAGSFAISVERDQAATAIAFLAQRGLPRQQFDSLGNIFDAKKVVLTPFEERARFMHAMNQELAHSISQIAGITSARVHIMMPEQGGLDRNKPVARASIFIYHLPEAPVTQHVPMVKNLIMNAVNGLNYEDIAVATFPTNPAPVANVRSADPAEGTSWPFVALALLLGAVSLIFRRPIFRSLGISSSR